MVVFMVKGTPPPLPLPNMLDTDLFKNAQTCYFYVINWDYLFQNNKQKYWLHWVKKLVIHNYKIKKPCWSNTSLITSTEEHILLAKVSSAYYSQVTSLNWFLSLNLQFILHDLCRSCYIASVLWLDDLRISKTQIKGGLTLCVSHMKIIFV